MNIMLHTAAAIVCFGVIWTHVRDRSLDRRHYRLLCITGIPSFIIGLTVIILTKQTDDILTGAVTILAWICFMMLSYGFFMRARNVSSREFTIMVLWGQAVYPTVILALPEVTRLLG